MLADTELAADGSFLNADDEAQVKRNLATLSREVASATWQGDVDDAAVDASIARINLLADVDPPAVDLGSPVKGVQQLVGAPGGGVSELAPVAREVGFMGREIAPRKRELPPPPPTGAVASYFAQWGVSGASVVSPLTGAGGERREAVEGRREVAPARRELAPPVANTGAVAVLFAEWGMPDAVSPPASTVVSPRSAAGGGGRAEIAPPGGMLVEPARFARREAAPRGVRRELQPRRTEAGGAPDLPAALAAFETAFGAAETTAGRFPAGFAATPRNSRIVAVHDL